jgi:hypothetical protein
MPNPAQRIIRASARQKKRALVALAAAFLLAIGFYGYSARTAPPARAATAVTGGLDVSIDPGSITVGLLTVRATVTYTCTDSDAPGGQAQLRVDFDQDGNDASGEVGVDCGSGDVSVPQTVTAVQVGMSGSQEITAAATLDDGDTIASDSADTVTRQIYTHLDPTLTFPGDGTVTLTGFYNCGSTFTSAAELFVSASQDNSSSDDAAGSAAVPVTTCDGTDQSFSVTITSSLSGAFVPDYPAVTATDEVDVSGTGWRGPSFDITLYEEA